MVKVWQYFQLTFFINRLKCLKFEDIFQFLSFLTVLCIYKWKPETETCNKKFLKCFSKSEIESPKPKHSKYSKCFIMAPYFRRSLYPRSFYERINETWWFIFRMFFYLIKCIFKGFQRLYISYKDNYNISVLKQKIEAKSSGDMNHICPQNGYLLLPVLAMKLLWIKIKSYYYRIKLQRPNTVHKYFSNDARFY